MCMWEGQSLGIEGETKVTSKCTCAFSFLLCFTVIDGHGLPPSHE